MMLFAGVVASNGEFACIVDCFEMSIYLSAYFRRKKSHLAHRKTRHFNQVVARKYCACILEIWNCGCMGFLIWHSATNTFRSNFQYSFLEALLISRADLATVSA
ncbi:MAG: hypothetical protein PHD65_09305 [Gallionella sp.]|nr:hypothetical protein [Gallionella sp.]